MATLDKALTSTDLASLLDQKIHEADNDVDRLEFTVLKALYTKRFEELLKLFGYERAKVVGEVEKALGRKLIKPEEKQLQPLLAAKQELKPMTAESAFDFFNQLGAQAGKPVEEAKQVEEPRLSMMTESVSRNTNWDEGLEGAIKRSLLIGNLEHAAEVALKAGRTTEALLIAEAGGEQLFEKIKEEYFANYCKDSFVKLQIKAIVNEDFNDLV